MYDNNTFFSDDNTFIIRKSLSFFTESLSFSFWQKTDYAIAKPEDLRERGGNPGSSSGGHPFTAAEVSCGSFAARRHLSFPLPDVYFFHETKEGTE